MKSKNYYLVEEQALPEALQKVIVAKQLLAEGKAANATQAAQMAGVSRSVFYKYRDSIRPFVDPAAERVITLYALLSDRRGVLTRFTQVLADVRTNVLTVNQNIPSNGTAPITVSIRGADMPITIPELLAALRAIEGVLSVDVVSGEMGE